MEIDRSAPVVAESSAFVSAPAKIVGDLLVDVNRWPQWNPPITSTSAPKMTRSSLQKSLDERIAVLQRAAEAQSSAG